VVEDRSDKVNRRVEIEKRIQRLIHHFDRYLAVFEQEIPFGIADSSNPQYKYHKKAIDRRFQLGSGRVALHDNNFIQTLHNTVREWLSEPFNARLCPLTNFASTVRKHENDIAFLEGLSIDSAGIRADEVASRVWNVISGLDIAGNEAKLVASTTALHHLLPDLVVPIDRVYTKAFFAWHPGEFQHEQERIFRHAFGHFIEIGRVSRPLQYVGRGWMTSRSKIVDNALVGFCIAENLS